MKRDAWGFSVHRLDEMIVDDAASFRRVALFADLRQILRRDDATFRVMPGKRSARWDRALLLNLTFWGMDTGGDVMVDRHIAADVVAHVGWHHLAALAFHADGKPITAEALLMGESIASAFDLYLVGILLAEAPRARFLETQVPAMAESALAAGKSARAFDRMLVEVASDPERAFEDLRRLLFAASVALLRSKGAGPAHASLAKHDGHRFAALLHHYELSTWILYARAYAAGELGPDRRVRAVDLALRGESAPLAWLKRRWVDPALVRGNG